MNRIASILVISLLFLAGCGSSDEPDDNRQAELNLAKQRWAQNKPDYYRYDFNLACFCMVSGNFDISVLDGEYVLARDNLIDGLDNQVPEELKHLLMSIDESFNLLQDAINNNAHVYEVSYDSQYGYPVSATLDIAENIADDEYFFGYEITETGEAFNILDNISEWNLVNFTTIVGVAPIQYGTEITLSFDLDNNTISGSAGCNSYSGDMSITGDQLTVSQIVSTEVYCMEPDGVMDQENNFLGGLSGMHTISFSSYQLSLVLGADAGMLFIPEGKQVEQSLSILSHRKSCDVVEVGQLLCLVVLDGQNTETNFADPIIGFYPKWGFNYEIVVQALDLPYSLVTIGDYETDYYHQVTVSEMEDDVGTLYRDETFLVTENSFTETSVVGTYKLIDETRFTCSAEVSCDNLLTLYQSASSVDLTFRYTGIEDTPLELVALTTN